MILKMSDQSYRKTLATHFHRLTGISRQDIFGDADSAQRPINLPEDYSTMFAGYVGTGYVPGQGFLFLAINPGGGGDTYTQRIPEDEVFYPLLHDFKAANEDSDVYAFEAINTAFVPIVKGWNLWRILEPTLDAAGAGIDATLQDSLQAQADDIAALEGEVADLQTQVAALEQAPAAAAGDTYRKYPHGTSTYRIINSAVTSSLVCTVGFINITLDILASNGGNLGLLLSYVPPAEWTGSREEYCVAWTDYWITGQNIPPFPF